LKVLLKKVTEESSVAAKVVATVDDIEAIAADDAADVPALHGWRRELFGEKALKLKHGELSLAVERGRVVVDERVPKPPPERGERKPKGPPSPASLAELVERKAT
jgi:ribonuclease D